MSLLKYIYRVTVAICNEAGTVLYYKMKDLQYF